MSQPVAPFLTTHPQLQALQALAKKSKVAVYLVGGFWRDFLSGRPTMDLDFAVAKDAVAFARRFADTIKAAFIILDEEHGCARVVRKTKGGVRTFDFADFRGPGLKQDLSHRDFTINTLAADIQDLSGSRSVGEVLIDYKQGRSDLRLRKIRMTGRRTFKEDPLRMLRAFSLRAILGFSLTRDTLRQIKTDKDLIRGVSAERVREELFKILASGSAAATLRSLDRVGLLENIIPQVRVMMNVRQGGYHHLDVWRHSLETVAQLEAVLRTNKDAELTAYLDEPLAAGHPRRALLKLAALLHDIGKPAALKREGQRLTFHGHEHIGKEMVRNIARMLKLSTGERHALEDLVLLHLRPGYLANFKRPSDRAVFRFLRDSRDEAVGICLLALADQAATRGPLTTKEAARHHAEICRGLIREYFRKKKEKPFVRLITGDDIIKELKLQPSPIFAAILRKVEEEQAAGKITTKEEALALAKKIAATQGSRA